MAKRRARDTRNVKGVRGATHPWALLLVDVINELEFDGAEKLLPKALAITRDGCASESPARHRHALDIMKKMLKSDIRSCGQIRFTR